MARAVLRGVAWVYIKKKNVNNAIDVWLSLLFVVNGNILQKKKKKKQK